MLVATSLSLLYPDTYIKALSNVNFTIKPGEKVAIIGQSGSGKTSIAKLLLGLIPKNAVTTGSIFFNGVDLLHLSETEFQKIRGKQIGIVLQDPQSALNPTRSIFSQLDEMLVLHALPESRGHRKSQILNLLQQMGVEHAERVLQAYPHELSGGIKQRICIAMAMLASPQLLVADEATSALDLITTIQIIELLRALPITLLFITHDLSIVSQIATRVLVFYKGVLVEDLPIEDLHSNAKHPYTKMLLGHSDVKTSALIPSLSQACCYVATCPNRSALCLLEQPQLRQIDEKAFVACHHIKEQLCNR